MIELIATAESVEQAQALLAAGVDKLVIGESVYGLRIPGNFTYQAMAEVTALAHQAGKKVTVAANAILHNDKIETARAFLAQLRQIGIDELLVGDTGLIQILKSPDLHIPYTYDASVLVTSPGQVNFWQKFGAISALVAREVPFVELEPMVELCRLPLTFQVYGGACIHHSGRPLIHNYFNFIEKEDGKVDGRKLFLSEPNKPETHYTIFEDSHGTHIFANDDLNLMAQVGDLHHIGVNKWYLDGIFTSGQAFVEIVALFNQARNAIETGTWSNEMAKQLSQAVQASHPQNRALGTGFFLYDADKVK